MASKNSVKVYSENAYYHLYNRGVEKRKIFLDAQDYSVFLSYLQTYLCPKNEKTLYAMLSSEGSTSLEKDKALKLLKLKNYYSQVQLVCYALLSNHFHLLVKQNTSVLNSFMNSLGTRYAMYFNRKYRRKGVLFQDVYKAVIVGTDEQLLQVSRYIHLNPVEALNLPVDQWEQTTFPSSLPEYLGKRQTSWIAKENIMDYFSKTNPHMTYESFLGFPLEGDLIADVSIDMEED